MIMAKLVAYDFYFLLRKFDSRLRERTFGDKPQFLPIPAQTVVNDLKDFLEVTGSLDADQDWAAVLRVLKDFKGADVVNPKLWTKLLADIREVKRAGILEMLVRCSTKDPDWVGESRFPRAHITGEYLEAVRLETFEYLTLITTAKQDARITEFAKTVFGDDDVDTSRLGYYTVQNSDLFKQRNCIGFTFARGLNYLFAFLLDEGEELQLFIDLVLIRGQWVSPALFRPLSESMRVIIHLPDTIKALDESLSGQGAYGGKLEKALTKTELAKSQIRYMNAALETLNSGAAHILTDAIFNLSVVADSLKDILEDYRRSIPVIILNWRELEPYSNGDLDGKIGGLHKKLGDMLDLLRLIMQGLDGAEEEH
jgi:hypothetical protein